MTDDPLLPTAYTWPAGQPLDAADAVATACAACGAGWRVHRSLGGFRLRCGCGAWVDVPAVAAPPAPAALPAPAVDLLPAAAVPSTDEQGLVRLGVEPGKTTFEGIPTGLPLAPGELRHASPTNQARWTAHTILEFAAMFAALLGPQLLALWWTRGQEFELLLPLASLLSGVLLLLVLAWAGPYARLGFRAARGRYWLEAVLAAGVALLCAVVWQLLLEAAFPSAPDDPLLGWCRRLGVPASLLVIAVAPAVLEEIVFRGALQGRLMALHGERLGLWLTAVAFAVCHMAPPVLVIHLGLGAWLGWLRQRSGSLLPGMLLHFLYNGSLVLLAA